MVSSSSNIKQKPSSIHLTSCNPEKTLRCVIEDQNPRLALQTSERKPDRFDELSSLRQHRRSNTQFIEDMKSNISMQFEKLKEFKVCRSNFQKVLQEKEDEFIKERSVNKFERPLTVNEQTLLNEDFGNYDYKGHYFPPEISATLKKKPESNEKKFFEETSSKYEGKYTKSSSCHYTNQNNFKPLRDEEEPCDIKKEVKISNKFSSNKTSNYLYGEMKIQEKRNAIEGQVMELRQKITKAKRSKNTQMKEVFELFDELNGCLGDLNEISDHILLNQRA